MHTQALGHLCILCALCSDLNGGDEHLCIVAHV